ncbi:MAG: hypothetical protein RIM84_23350 [Alphaproteobacteria bacterium]
MKPLAMLTAAAAMLALTGCGTFVKVNDPEKLIVVPAGHMPPSGLCRYWYPDRHISQQPSSGNCNALKDEVPEGAYLIRT